jgi:hypothetical protein
LARSVCTTEAVDLFVEGSEENLAKVIPALSEMEDGAAKELTPARFAEERGRQNR